MASKMPLGWKACKIREVANVGNGSTPSRSEPRYWENGVYPWLPTAKVNDRIITRADQFISQSALNECSIRIYPAGSVLVGMIGQGKTRGSVAYLAIDASINQNFACVTPRPDLDSWYLFHYLDFSYQQLRNFSHGSNQGALNCDLIGQFPIVLPPLSEQNRISQILSTWDNAISLTEKLLAALQKRKKGLIQRLLAQQVRISGFKEEWKIVPLRDAFERVRRKVSDKKVEYILSITATVGFVDQREKFGKVIAGKNLANYILLQKGEFAYNKGNSNAYPQGCVYLLEEFDAGAVPSVYFSFAAKNTKEINTRFYKHYFESGALNTQFEKYISSSVRADGLFNIAFDDFFSVKIPLPPIEEQEKIATVLDTCDTEIKLQIKKLDALKQQKKGLMQKLLTGEIRVKV